MYRLGHFRVCVCDAGVISLVLTPPFLFVLFLLFSILDRGASVLTLSLFLFISFSKGGYRDDDDERGCVAFFFFSRFSFRSAEISFKVLGTPLFFAFFFLGLSLTFRAVTSWPLMLLLAVNHNAFVPGKKKMFYGQRGRSRQSTVCIAYKWLYMRLRPRRVEIHLRFLGFAFFLDWDRGKKKRPSDIHHNTSFFEKCISCNSFCWPCHVFEPQTLSQSNPFLCVNRFQTGKKNVRHGFEAVYQNGNLISERGKTLTRTFSHLFWKALFLFLSFPPFNINGDQPVPKALTCLWLFDGLSVSGRTLGRRRESSGWIPKKRIAKNKREKTQQCKDCLAVFFLSLWFRGAAVEINSRLHVSASLSTEIHSLLPPTFFLTTVCVSGSRTRVGGSFQPKGPARTTSSSSQHSSVTWKCAPAKVLSTVWDLPFILLLSLARARVWVDWLFAYASCSSTFVPSSFCLLERWDSVCLLFAQGIRIGSWTRTIRAQNGGLPSPYTNTR